MNRLQLCQRLMLECGVSGTLTSTLNQTGEFNRLVTWVDQAWSDLQTKHDDWNWMRSSNVLGQGASFPTVAAQASYPLGTGGGTVGILADNFGKWDVETFRCYTTLAGTNDEMFLENIPYDSWRDAYYYGALRQVQTRPVAVAVGPNKSVCLGPPSNGLYTVTADYFVAPRIMTTDTDVPTGLPSQFHTLIVWNAMLDYSGYEAAPEVMDRAEKRRTTMLAQLEGTNMPAMEFAGALA